MEQTLNRGRFGRLKRAMILPRVEQFLRRTGLSAARFGRLAAGDPRLVFDLRNGRLPRSPMEARLEHFMNNYLEQIDAH